MARGKKREDLAPVLAAQLEDWATQHGVANDPYVLGMADALREKKNLPLWAEVNPLDHLPHPEPSSNRRIAAISRRLSILRGVLLFAPVALTWYAVGQASEGFSQYIEENPNAVVNFLEFWQNGYGYIAEEWTLTRIAFLDFLIIALVIVLTVVVAMTTKRAQQVRSTELVALDAERFEVALVLSQYLFDKRAITPVTMKDSLAKSIQDLANSTKSLNESAKALEKLTKALPNNSEILKEVKKLKPSFSFDWDK